MKSWPPVTKFLFFSLWALGLAVFLIWFFWEIPVLSPLDSKSTFNFLATQPKGSGDKIIYGFLPYWNLNTYILQPELTHLSYFSLGMAGNGQILTHENDYLAPGYAKLDSDELAETISQLNKNSQKFELTLTQFNNDDIYQFLSSQKAQENLIKSLDSILLAYPVSGINIDIEYTGQVDDKLRANFVQFMHDLNLYLDQKYSHINLSISVYASSASKYLIWDIAGIGQEVDYIVVMAYDFHQRSSIQAGPVAPLFGGKEFWDNDISNYLQDFVKQVSASKILLGVPFYGYEWQVTSRDPQAHTFEDTGSTASYKRVQDLLLNGDREKLQVQEAWNEEALSPYLTYIEDEQIWAIYYENSRSISYKLDLVNQLDLAGIAIWALGYEGESRELWEVIKRKF